MTAVAQHPAFAAFENQLRTLCLKEFPCGPGHWRETEKKSNVKVKDKKPKIIDFKTIGRVKKKQLQHIDPTRYQFSVTHQDYGVQYEKTETLQEYVTSKVSPWHLDYSWSEEARCLREIAVKSPWLIDDSFILNHFRTIRILDKKVTDVDADILKFQYLEELTLSANYIQIIPSQNLPRTLKVLELCANEISDISSLCEQPPRLTHLGLGYNKITYIRDYLTGNYWPSLLSLDLSYNNLSDLVDCVRKLSTLPKLRNLILQGNPLSLIPGYRGYIVDVMRKLSILDDMRISADEKHHFKGLARRREYILDEGKITLEVLTLKGLPIPEEIKNPEDHPEFPIIERTYFVQFLFLEDSGGKVDISQLTQEENHAPSTIADTDRKQLEETTEPTDEVESHTGDTVTTVERNVAFNSRPDLKSVDNVQDIESVIPPSQLEGEMPQGEQTADQNDSDDDKSKVNIAPIKSEMCTWAEEVELNWSSMLIRDNLLALRDFFKQGMDFSVIEQVVLCYPVEEEEVETASNAGSRKGSRAKDRGKDKKAKGGGSDKKDEKKKKKKGEPEKELRRTPPQLNTLASFHMSLEDFVDGEFECVEVFTVGSAEVTSTVVSVQCPVPGKKDKKDTGNKKKTPMSPRRKEEKKKDHHKGTAKSKDADKKGDKKRKNSSTLSAESPDLPPPPLEIQVAVRLHHWTTALDSIREEEEKNQALQQEGN